MASKYSSIFVALVLVFATAALSSMAAGAFATSSYVGTATHCSGVISCTFAIPSAAGAGLASTYGGVGGYVGQNLTFYGATVSFKLPGEPVSTFASGVYSGKAIVSGYSSTAGTLYHVTGTFSATDANNGKIVSGSTDVTVGVKGHSGRGGGVTWSLVAGKITLTQTNIDGTAMSVVCSPSSIAAGSSATCSVNVTDLNKVSGSIPTGTVTFYASNTWLGSFSPSSCALSSVTGSCSVNFLTSQEYGGGTTSIYASYNGDSGHSASSARTVLYVIAPVDNSSGGD